MSVASLWMAWLHGLVAGGVVLLAGRLLMACLGEPARQHHVAWWAAMSALAAPFVCMLPGWWTLPLPTFDPFPAAAAVPNDAEAAVEPAVAAIDIAALESMPFDLLDEVSDEGDVAIRAENAGFAWGWREIFFGAVLGHVCFVLLWASRLIAGAWRLNHWWRRAEAPSAELQAKFDSLADEMCVPRARLRLSAHCGVPLCFGIGRPKVLLPQTWRETSDRPMRWVLAHELSHLRRRDPAANWVWSLAQALFGLWPWTWTLTRQARLCQEFLADAEAARREEQATAGAVAVEDYAAFLVRLSADRRAPAGAVAANAQPSDLMRRIVMLTQRARTIETQCPRRWTLAFGAGLFGLAAVLGGMQTRASAAPIKETPKEEKPAPKSGLDRQIEEALKELEKANPQAADTVQGDPLRLQRDLREALKKMQIGANGDVARQIEEIEKIQKQMIDQLQRQINNMPRVGGGAIGGVIINPRLPIGGVVRPLPATLTNRLGVRLQLLPPAMVEQMDLPEGQGLIIADVNANSPAEKAGFKKHDVILEIGGTKVQNSVPGFQNQLRGMKDEPVDATVIRKGKRETVKGVKLADANAVQPGNVVQPLPAVIRPAPGGVQIQPGNVIPIAPGQAQPVPVPFPNIQIQPGQAVPNIQIVPGNIQIQPAQPGQALPVPNIQIQGLPGGALPNIQFPNIQLPNAQGGAVKVQAVVGGGNAASTAISRNNDDFSIEHTSNGLKMSVQGKVENGKATPSNIVIQDGDAAVRAATMEQVPEKYRGQLERILQGIR